MIKFKFFIAFVITAIFSFLMITCNSASPTDQGTIRLQPGDCKTLNKSSLDPADGIEDCIIYSFNNSLLDIQHTNAAFNCCPGHFIISVQINGDSIIVTEQESQTACRCNCLYDIQYSLNIQPGEYALSIIEPYAPADSILSTTINTTSEPEGQFCITRNTYPWTN